MLRVDQPQVMQLGTPECPGGLRAGWPLLVVPVVVALVTGTFRVLQHGPDLLDCYKDFFSWAFCYTDSGQSRWPQTSHKQPFCDLSLTHLSHPWEEEWP